MLRASCPVQKQRIAILASPATRVPGAEAYEFVRQQRERLHPLQLVTTGGAYDLFKDKPDLSVERYPGHDEGGLTLISADIVDGNLGGVITFPDLKRPSASLTSVDNVALFNRALCKGIEIMVNRLTANLWVTGQTGIVKPEEETLALIAHTATSGRDPKAEITKLAEEFQVEFSRFQRILCTGNTGGHLKDAVPLLRDKIIAYESGMKGGDTQIAREIVLGRCQHVVFLVNPEWAQPHEADVQSFIIDCRRFGVNLMFTFDGAWRWVGALRQQFGNAA